MSLGGRAADQWRSLRNALLASPRFQRFALAFLVAMNAPGLTILGRSSFHHGESGFFTFLVKRQRHERTAQRKRHGAGDLAQTPSRARRQPRAGMSPSVARVPTITMPFWTN